MVFYEKQLVEGFLCDNHHCQATIVGTTESYNELFKNSASSQFCRAFTSKNAKKLDFVENDQTEEEVEDEEDDDEINACPQFRKTFFWEASRKSLSSAIWLWLVICEAAERKCLDETLFGPKLVCGERVTFVQSLNTFMKDTDEKR